MNSDDAAIHRIDCVSDNRVPNVVASASTDAGVSVHADSSMGAARGTDRREEVNEPRFSFLDRSARCG